MADSQQDENYLFAGQVTFVGGQDASKVPALVTPDRYFAGVNLQVSSGVPKPRWGVNKKNITFPSGGVTIPISNAIVTYDEIFHSGRFQAMIPYNIGPDWYIIFVVSGIIFLVNQNTWAASVLPIQGGSTLNENTPRLNWAPAGNYTVIFDYPNFPVILDGITARRADPAKFEVPVSVGGAYNQNRLFIYNAGNDYTAGDPTGDLAAPEAPVTFNEVEQPASPVFGEIFQLPTARIEDITAMGFLQLTDSSTGIGPLLIGTENAIYSVQAQQPRTTIDSQGNVVPNWEQNGFASAFVLNAGIAGFRAWCNVNSDFFFASPDGAVRSATMSRAEQGQWARVPISKEVQNWIGTPDPKLTSYTVMAYFNNKILISVNPYRTSALNTNREPIFDVAFGGFVILSLDNVSTLGHDGAPAWDGLWTPFRPMDIAVNNKRLFAISKDAEFRNEVYEIDPEQTFDTDGSSVRYAHATLYSREFDFQTPFNDKDLHSLDLDLRSVQGDFKFLTQFKPSQGSRFVDWQQFSNCAPWRDCLFPADEDLNGFAGHSFMGLNLGSPVSDACDPVSSTPYSVFRKVQLKFIIEGKYWELVGYRLKALVKPQSFQIDSSCDDGSCIKLPRECITTDWDIPPFKGCLTNKT